MRTTEGHDMGPDNGWISGTSGHPSALGALGTDQVMRKRRFIQANPDVEIVSPKALGGNDWLAHWTEENGSTTIHRSDLRFLLDELESRFGVPERPE